MKRNNNRCIFLVIYPSLLCGSTAKSAIYVDINATGLKGGLTWSDAFVNLQDGLEAAASDPNQTQIWMAEGTYYPTSDCGLGPDEHGKNFQMINDIGI